MQLDAINPQGGRILSNIMWFLLGEFLIVMAMVYLIRTVNGQDAESRQLYFGSVVLTAMTLVFILSMAMYYWAEGAEIQARAQKIFEACLQVIPPLLTLVIGFYFGKRSETKAVSKPENT
ncbi:hypothetical protein HF313_16320 [Massilia atriviolacea]